MSRKIPKYDYLPKLQKKIVLCLAQYGAMTMAKTRLRLKDVRMTGDQKPKSHHQTATNLAFHKLESENMVNKVGTWPYRGQKFDTYWLSNRGLAFAMKNGAKAETVKRNYECLSHSEEDKRALEFYFKVRSVSPKIANALDDFMLAARKVTSQKLLARLISEMVSFDEADMKKVFDMTAEFPGEWKVMLEALKKLSGMAARVSGKMLSRELEKSKGE